MKKIFLLFTAAALSAGMVFAQDINQATENYNNGAMELNMGNNDAAITYFQTALEMAEALGEEGAEVAANCRNIIPAIYLSSAKEQIKAENYDAAVEQLNKAIEAAGKYENPEVADDANALMPQVYLSKGNGFLQAKNFRLRYFHCPIRNRYFRPQPRRHLLKSCQDDHRGPYLPLCIFSRNYR